MTEKIEMSELQMKVDPDRKLVGRNARLVECNLKLAERMAKYHDDDEERTKKWKETLQVLKMTEKKVDLDRELVERNARLAECNLKLAERLAKYDEEERTEEKTKDANLPLKKKCLKSFIGNISIGGVMIACRTGILGYFGGGGGSGMTIKNIMTVGGIGVYGYGVQLLMSKITYTIKLQNK